MTSCFSFIFIFGKLLLRLISTQIDSVNSRVDRRLGDCDVRLGDDASLLMTTMRTALRPMDHLELTIVAMAKLVVLAPTSQSQSLWSTRLNSN